MYNCKYCDKTFDTAGKLGGHTSRCKMNPINRQEYQCPHCFSVVVGKQSFSLHVNHCEKNPVAQKYQAHRSSADEKIVCEFCGRECKNKNSYVQHRSHCPKNPNRSISNIEKVRTHIPSWNKGKTKETDERVAKNGDAVKESRSIHGGTFKGKHHSDYSKKLMSVAHVNLWNSGEGRKVFSHSGWYDELYFMSTWELAYYVYMRDHGHTITRCKERFSYTYEGGCHYYYPDFVVDGRIVETKGFETDLDRVKYQAVPNLLVIKSNEVEPMIEYVKKAYNVARLEELYRVKNDP